MSAALPMPVLFAKHNTEGVAARVLVVDVALRWLVNLRWHAVFGQAVTIAIAVAVFHLQLPVAALLTLVAATALSNVLLKRACVRPMPRTILWPGAVIVGDTLVFTSLLALSGGAANPFAILYLAHVAIAALVLDRRWTIAIVSLVVLAFGLLSFCAEEGDPATSHGRWFAFALTAGVVALIVRRLAATVREGQDAVGRAERARLRAETVAALGTLAAGAAHELGTPLGTIAIASNELDELIETSPHQAALDARLIRDEVERCRAILQRMSARAGAQTGEFPITTTLEAIQKQTLDALPRAEHARLRWRISSKGAELHVPVLGLVQTLVSLASNALAASRSDEGIVDIEARVDAEAVSFFVSDRGPGIPSAIRDRLGDPFLTTRRPGEGMGLGIFLCQSFVDAWSGELVFDCPRAGGTTVFVRLPRRIER